MSVPVRFPLSPQQQQLWIDEVLRPGTARNSTAFTVTARLDATRLRAAVAAATALHPMLRARVHVDDDGVPFQVLADAPPVRVRHEAEAVADLAAVPFVDLAQPLVRFDLWPGVLLVTAHHLVMDGTSGDLLADALAAGYADPSVPRRPDSGAYADYATARVAALDGPTTSADEFWDAHLENLGPQPTWDAPGPCRGPLVRVLESAPLRRAAAGRHTSVTALALAATAAALAQRHPRADLLLGLAASHRPPGWEHTLGTFVDVLPLRVPLPTGSPAAQDLLPAIRSLLLDLLDVEPAPALRTLRRHGRRIRIETSLSVRRSWTRTFALGEESWVVTEQRIPQSPYPCSVELCEGPDGTHTLAVHHDPDRLGGACAEEVLDAATHELLALTRDV